MEKVFKVIERSDGYEIRMCHPQSENLVQVVDVVPYEDIAHNLANILDAWLYAWVEHSIRYMEIDSINAIRLGLPR